MQQTSSAIVPPLSLSLLLASTAVISASACGDGNKQAEVYVEPATSGGTASGGANGSTVEFCEAAEEEMAMGGSCSDLSFTPKVESVVGLPVDRSADAVHEVGSPYWVRYSLDDLPTISARFNVPVCGVAQQVFAIPRVGDAKDESVDVTFNDSRGAYEIVPNAADWQSFDTFDLTFRRDIVDSTCDSELENQAAFPIIACSEAGWPTAGWPGVPLCRPSPESSSIETEYCPPIIDGRSEESPTELFFACGKSAAEGRITGQPAPLGSSQDPPLNEIYGHAYKFVAPMGGEYEFILDGTRHRRSTIMASTSADAEKACDDNEDFDCGRVGAKVQLAIGTSCGKRDVYSDASVDTSCALETTQTFVTGETVYVTVLSDTDSGCGLAGSDPCDYGYTLWIKSPGAD